MLIILIILILFIFLRLKPVVGAVDSHVAVADGNCCCLIPNTGARVDCSVEDRFDEAGSADDHLTSSAGEPQER